MFFAVSSCDMIPIPPPRNYRKTSRCKYQTRPGSAASSGTTSPSSPTHRWQRRKNPISSDNASEEESSGNSSSNSSLRGLSRLFRRSSSHKPAEPTFCGYTMGRDFRYNNLFLVIFSPPVWATFILCSVDIVNIHVFERYRCV